MFLRLYKRTDKKALQHLFFDTVHHVCAAHYAAEQLWAWAPAMPNREAWETLDKGYCFVVDYEKNPVGFAAMSPDGVLEMLYVHKAFQRRGIAGALLKQLYRLARKKGMIVLKVSAPEHARSFFEQQGFVGAPNTVPQSQEPVLGLVYMEKQLDSAAPAS